MPSLNQASGFRLKAAVLLGLVLFLSGCAQTTVRLNGYLDQKNPVVFTKADSFHFRLNPDAPNPLLEKEIGAKVERLLTHLGYGLAAEGAADFWIEAAYGVTEIISTAPPTGRVRVGMSMGFGFGGGCCWGRPYPGGAGHWRPGYGHGWGYGMGYGWGYPAWPDYDYYAPQPGYDRALSLKVINARTGETAWLMETDSQGYDPDLRAALDYLLAATFLHFGEDTEQARLTAIDAGNELVGVLRER